MFPLPTFKIYKLCVKQQVKEIDSQKKRNRQNKFCNRVYKIPHMSLAQPQKGDTI